MSRGEMVAHIKRWLDQPQLLLLSAYPDYESSPLISSHVVFADWSLYMYDVPMTFDALAGP